MNEYFPLEGLRFKPKGTLVVDIALGLKLASTIGVGGGGGV